MRIKKGTLTFIVAALLATPLLTQSSVFGRVRTTIAKTRSARLLHTTAPTHKKITRIKKDPHATIQALGFKPSLLPQCKQLFAHVPGFATIQKRITTTAHNGPLSHLKGALWELQTAFYLHCCGEEICWFEQKLQHPHTGIKRELDIGTQRLCAECKNYQTSTWASVWTNTTSRQQFQQQITEQKAIIDALNAHNGTHYTHVLCSKHPLTPEWQQWLDKQGITYIDGPTLATQAKRSFWRKTASA